jgi:hypothetical protein
MDNLPSNSEITEKLKELIDRHIIDKTLDENKTMKFNKESCTTEKSLFPGPKYEDEVGKTGFMATLGKMFHYKSPYFYIIFILSLSLLWLPLPPWGGQYTINLSNNDRALTLINIILFATVTMCLFYFFLSKDIEKIAIGNVNFYTDFIKLSDPMMYNKVKSGVRKIRTYNKDEFDKHDKWKANCNQFYNKRVLGYIMVVVILLIMLIIFAKLTGVPVKFNKPFILTIFLMVFVFSTELYMLLMVFTKIILIGEFEILYKIFKSMGLMFSTF